MRATTVLRVLLALQHTRVLGFEFDQEGLVIDVAPSFRRPRCGECGRKLRDDDVVGSRKRRWRHLDLGGIQAWVRYEIRRVECPSCGVHVEQVPWAEIASRYTRAFENQAAYLAQRVDKTTVTEVLRIAWRTVGGIVRRVVQRHRGTADDGLDGLRIIGVDELSYRRHHEYVTVVWAAEGKSAATLKRFFDTLGPERCAKLEAVTIDLSGAYIKAVTEASPQAKIIFDRFHVQRLAHDAVDEVRREEVRSAVPADKRELKRTRWALQKNPWNLSPFEERKLTIIQQVNKRLYRAYLLKETLLAVLDRRQPGVARQKLTEWLSWAARSKLAPFVKLAKTIRKHQEGILAYVDMRLTNAVVEGLNGKARTITRRSFGFHSAASLIAMLFLCCSGIQLHPSHVLPFFHH
jgi:transposase